MPQSLSIPLDHSIRSSTEAILDALAAKVESQADRATLAVLAKRFVL
jgi:hypothetical protein